MRSHLASVCALIATLRFANAQERNQLQPGADPDFKPVLISVDLTTRLARPGSEIGVTYRFKNTGTQPAKDDYSVFVHLEHPSKSCTNLVSNLDHLPTIPTSAWSPAQEVSDGPHVFRAPTASGEATYHVHVGVYAPQLPGGPRLLDVYAGELKVSREAPAAKDIGPKPLPEGEIARRRHQLAERVQHPVELSNDALTFRLDRESLAYEIVDRSTGIRWTSSPAMSHFASVKLTNGEQTRNVLATELDEIRRDDGGGLTLVSALKFAGKDTGITVSFRLDEQRSPAGLHLSYKATEDGEWKVRSVTVLDDAFGTTDADDGYLVIPRRLGEILPVTEALPHVKTLPTYSGTSMAMCGIIKQANAMLLAWPHPETILKTKIDWPKHELVPGVRRGSVGIELHGAAREVSIHPIGRGGYVEVAKAYRAIAKRNGWLMTWAEKRKRYPTVARMFGAADFKPFVFSRTVPSSRFGGPTERTHLGYTFEEVAQCAKHWHDDLGIDKAMVVMAGWIHRGYDNQHPDVLPAAPECGGNEALARSAHEIKSLGYLFGLHDNYQDMYQDAPSWGESYINKRANGQIKMGGNWAGGQAYQVCAIKQVELAARPQNLPMVKQLFGPTIYFIDTTFAWGLVTCDDPAHPMTRRDDMIWKSKLCDLAKKHFGLFGSEEGREWAVPHADYMEGLLSHKTKAAKSGRVIPLFEMVYGDCVSLYTHQGDRIGAGNAKKVLDHILYAEMHLPQFGGHLYWKTDGPQAVPVQPIPPVVKATGELEFEITYRWRVLGKVDKDLWCFVHFTHPEATRGESIAYQDDHAPSPAMTAWQPGQVVEVGPRKVAIPPQFTGESQLLIGLTDRQSRKALSNIHGGNYRYPLGAIKTTPKGPAFVPASNSSAACFSRADNGWAAGLCVADRTIKNTYEVLSPLNRLTAETPMTAHSFLAADHHVERTAFGHVQIVVNYGPEPYEFDGCVLPAYGFLVTSPTFIAFHAQRYNGIDYRPTALFTIRSLDGKPIAQSRKVRVYHGFGPETLRLSGRAFEVRGEETVSVR